jgi:hypothetical protein
MTELGLVLKARTVMLPAGWPFAFVVPSEAERSAVCLGRQVVSALRRTADPSAPAEAVGRDDNSKRKPKDN